LASFSGSSVGISLVAAGLGIIPQASGISFLLPGFYAVDVAGAALAFAFEKEDYKKLLWMIPKDWFTPVDVLYYYQIIQ
jgi:hypothetical protein